MVTLTGVSKSYHHPVQVLNHIDLQLKKGDFLYVVGGSGAGKSSLLRMLATEESPSQGTVSLFGYNLSRIAPTTLRAIRQSIGYIPQNLNLIPDFTVYDNVALSVSLSGRRGLDDEKKKWIDLLLHQLGLAAKHDVQCRFLSGGEAQRVNIARALARTPELIIADEPTGAQDREYTWAAMDLFVRANLKGATVVIATHDREIVRRVRKPCAILKEGRISVGENLCFF